MLRVYDGGCLWCPYVNVVHDVHRRHSPSCVWRHIAPQGDKQDKNRYADGRNIGCRTVVTHYIYCSMSLRTGFIGEARFIAWCFRDFYSVFVNKSWYATCRMRYYLRTSMNWGSTSTEAAKTSGMMTTIWRLRLCATLTKRPSIVSMAPPCIFTLCPLVMLISSGRI